MRFFWFFLSLFIVACSGDEPPFVPPDGGFEGEVVVAAPDAWDGQKRGEITYQLLVYSFADSSDPDRIGDLRGLISKLDYIDRLGASAVWLSPIHPSGSYHGYDVLDYDAVNPLFGHSGEFDLFIHEAHSRGIRVYLDWVLNHTSSLHPWFTDARDGGEYRDFYVFSDNPSRDIAEGKIAQIATEGAAGYEPLQWFSTNADAGYSGRLRFTLDWNARTVTVTESSAPVDADNAVSYPDERFLYFGDGISKRFYYSGDGVYELVVDFSSEWGFLIRTTTASWNAGEKWGGAAGDVIELGVPFALDSATAADIQFARSDQFHSFFGTNTFADLDYGAAASGSGAFDAVVAAARRWIDRGVDGFRLDAVKHIYHNGYSDENPTFLRRFYDAVGGDVYMVGEMYEGYARVAPYYAGLPALFEFDFWARLRWALQNGVGRYFAKDVMEMREVYSSVRPDFIAATKLTNHDEVRAGTELGGSAARMKLAAAVLLTAGGEPYIYQGEELGYRGNKDGGDEWVRTPIMWDAAGRDLADGALGDRIDRGMLTADISVESQSSEAGSVLDVYRVFARLRNTYPALADGAMVRHEVYNDSNSAFEPIAAWYRELDGQRMLVVHNFGSAEKLLAFERLGRPVGVLGEVLWDQQKGQVKMGGYSSVVFKL